MELSEIRALAPSPVAWDRAQQMAADTHRQSGMGQGGALIWGQFQGSTPYLAQVDQERWGFKCTCPSRQQPCKHVLALLLVQHHAPDSLPEHPVPEPIQQWVERRRASAKAQQTRAQAQGPVDTEAQQRRRDKREANVDQGLEQLQRWMEDLAQAGLGSLRSGEAFEQQARRMVDAQAGGIASRLRSIGDDVGIGTQWPQRVAQQLGVLALLVEAWRNQDALSPELRASVREKVGFRVRQADLNTPVERARWQILGQSLREEERGNLRQSWLHADGELRMLMEFAPSVMGGRFQTQLPVGHVLDCTLQPFPGAVAERAALVEEHGVPVPMTAPPQGLPDLDALLELRARTLSRDPFARRVLAVVEGLIPAVVDGQALLIDRHGQSLPLLDLPWWEWVALCGGRPHTLLVQLGAEAILRGGWVEGRWRAGRTL
ncbi:MAG: SWIM zinc finger family protein [Myxococcota bacterium]|nr:SWIM zinc finger family protein [Myxococcota bacterium]